MDAERIRRESGFVDSRKALKSLHNRRTDLGQCYPQRCPEDTESLREPLGSPLSIREAAELIGCSPWTVRQRYIPAGLPHHRLTPNGKLIFYRNQIIRWLIASQQKGEKRS